MRARRVDKVTEILSQKKKLLTEVYFDLQLHFEEKYGEDALVLMEIGTFFEVYEVNNDDLKVKPNYQKRIRINSSEGSKSC